MRKFVCVMEDVRVHDMERVCDGCGVIDDETVSFEVEDMVDAEAVCDEEDVLEGGNDDDVEYVCVVEMNALGVRDNEENESEKEGEGVWVDDNKSELEMELEEVADSDNENDFSRVGV